MPLSELTYAEAAGALPTVCVWCGAPATCWQTKHFHVHNVELRGRGVGGMIVLTQEMSRWTHSRSVPLKAPFCTAHRDHWASRNRLLWSFVIGTPVALAVVLGVAAALEAEEMLMHGMAVLISLVGILGGALVYGKTVRKFTTNDRGIVVANLHPKFVAALVAQRARQTSSPAPPPLAPPPVVDSAPRLPWE